MVATYKYEGEAGVLPDGFDGVITHEENPLANSPIISTNPTKTIILGKFQVLEKFPDEGIQGYLDSRSGNQGRVELESLGQGVVLNIWDIKAGRQRQVTITHGKEFRPRRVLIARR
ncbi:MAG: hypothetical protein WC596_03065 [Candidatus Shapirobacteria bacterium]